MGLRAAFSYINMKETGPCVGLLSPSVAYPRYWAFEMLFNMQTSNYPKHIYTFSSLVMLAFFMFIRLIAPMEEIYQVAHNQCQSKGKSKNGKSFRNKIELVIICLEWR